MLEQDEKITVVELFAGVGGFRLGFESASDLFETVWANQWEPGRKTQYAYDCYKQNFGEKHNCINEDIAVVNAAEVDANADAVNEAAAACPVSAITVA